MNIVEEIRYTDHINTCQHMIVGLNEDEGMMILNVLPQPTILT